MIIKEFQQTQLINVNQQNIHLIQKMQANIKNVKKVRSVNKSQ